MIDAILKFAEHPEEHMGHLLRTENPEAADRFEDQRPLPGIGEIVIYWPRIGERRRGRERIPAIVTAQDVPNRHLTLIIMHEASDMMDQERVPERVGDDRGWQRMAVPGGADPAEVTGLRQDLAELRSVVLGEFDIPPQPVLALIDALDERVDGLESATAGTRPAKPQPKKAAKKRRGR